MSDTYHNLDKRHITTSLDIARWCGFLSILLGASKAVMLILSEQILLKKTRKCKNHLIIIGSDEFANVLALEAIRNNKKVTWLAASAAQKKQHLKNLFIDDAKWNLKETELFGLEFAHSVTIATGDDATDIAIAREIRSAYPDENKLVIHVNIVTPWLAMRFDQIQGVEGLHLISNAQSAIRLVHRKYPPFLIAKNLNHKRIHTVIVGFGLYGEAVMVDTILSCLTSYLEAPCFTIIDPNAASIENSLKIKYPDLQLTAKLNFITKSVEGSNHSINEEEWLAIGKDNPVTNTYICLPEETTSLSAGLALQTLAIRNSWVTGPIFIKLSTNQALPACAIDVKHLTTAQMISWGDLNSLIKETGILNDDRDGMAKTMHQAYCDIAGSYKEANVPWEQLNEDARESNRRVVVHIAAKLSSAGMDIEPWLKKWDRNPQVTQLPKIDNILDNKKLHLKLAILEHDRWMADRRLSGWQYGKTKDITKRLHPDLVPFDQLSQESQSYDMQITNTLIKILSRS